MTTAPGRNWHNDRLESMERFSAQRRRLLDVGSGTGAFLKTAKTRGWRVFGIESSRQASAQARKAGIEVAEGFFDAGNRARAWPFRRGPSEQCAGMRARSRSTSRSWRAICSTRAACFASTCPTISRPSRSPDAPPSAPRNGGSPRRYHLNYFDFESAAGLLERLGIEIVERTTSFPMEAFLMMGDDYTTDRELGRACHKKRKRFDLALEAAGFKETRRAFYRALANSGMGREVVLIAVKP